MDSDKKEKIQGTLKKKVIDSKIRTCTAVRWLNGDQGQLAVKVGERLEG